MILSSKTIRAIQQEVDYAHKVHGEDSMYSPKSSNDRRLAILVEEVGEVAAELNEAASGNLDETNLRLELIQVAAMAATWLEALDAA